MWGDRYWGPRFWGNRYWGGIGGSSAYGGVFTPGLVFGPLGLRIRHPAAIDW